MVGIFMKLGFGLGFGGCCLVFGLLAAACKAALAVLGAAAKGLAFASMALGHGMGRLYKKGKGL